MTTWKAPGKLILFGEHAVVHGAHAVAAALSLNTVAAARFTPRADAAELGVSVHTEHSGGSERLDAAVRAVAEAVDPRARGELELWLRSSVPAGAGLGSSAALCVSAAAAIGDALANYRTACSSAWLAAVNDAALAGERVFHKNPSGIDNTVATYGGVVCFARCTTLKRAPVGAERGLRVVVVDTGVPRATGDAVAAVQARLDRDRAAVEAAFARIDAIAEKAFSLLQAAPVDHAALDALVDENHALLRDALGVSHPAVERAVALCAECGVHAKLTGAGCGGCVFGFVHGASSNSLASLVRRAEEAGMRAHVLVLGAPGVSEVPTPPPA